MVTKTPLEAYQLGMVNRDHAARIAMKALDRVQTYDPVGMVMGSALLFAAMCERCGLDAGETYRMAQRILNNDEAFHQRANIQVQALKDFAGIRVMGDANVSIA